MGLGRKILQGMLVSCGLCSAAAALAALPKQALVPGGVAIVPLNIVSTSMPAVYFQNKRAVVVADPQQPAQWLAVVGIPIDIIPGLQTVNIVTQAAQQLQEFKVANKQYRREYINLPNKRKVEPLPEDMPIIEAEYLETINTYNTWQFQDLKSLALSLPVKGRKSSPFGLQRIFNKIPLSPHSGLDIAAPQGTPVITPKAGVVLNTGDYFYSGKIVFLDHGQGFISSYCHLDQILVSKGQHLQQGEVLGTVGKTGRATGPHLHWSVSLNGVRVNPELFLIE